MAPFPQVFRWIIEIAIHEMMIRLISVSLLFGNRGPIRKNVGIAATGSKV